MPAPALRSPNRTGPRRAPKAPSTSTATAQPPTSTRSTWASRPEASRDATSPRSLPSPQLGTGGKRREVASSAVVCPPPALRGENPPSTDFFCARRLSSTAGRLEVLMSDRVTDRRRVAQLARHYRDQEGLSIAEIARRLGRAEDNYQGVISTIRPAIRHARSRRATGECVAAAGRPPRRGTARATPTRIANAAIPARSRRNGPGSGFAKRCGHGERATALRRRPTSGRAPTYAGAAPRR